MRREKSGDSSDEDYASRAHKKKAFSLAKGGSGAGTPMSDADAAWRRGAAKKVVTYDEAQVDYGLESEEDDVIYYEEGESHARESYKYSSPGLMVSQLARVARWTR